MEPPKGPKELPGSESPVRIINWGLHLSCASQLMPSLVECGRETALTKRASAIGGKLSGPWNFPCCTESQGSCSEGILR